MGQLHKGTVGLLGVYVLAALLLAVGCHASGTQGWTPAEYPNPLTDALKCGRPGVNRSWVCDPDGVLSQESANVVEGTVAEIAAGKSPYAASPCGAGYQVAVALLKHMAPQGGLSPAALSQVFAKQLHDAWGVGSAACNDGLLMLLATEDRQVYISTGAGGQAALPNERVAEVIEQMKPALRKGNYADAVEQAVVNIGLGLAGAPPSPPEEDEDGEGGLDWVTLIFGALFVGVLGRTCWVGTQRRREHTRCRNLLEKLKKESAEAMRHRKYPTASCPICLEDFTPADAPAASPSVGAGAGPSSAAALSRTASRAASKSGEGDKELSSLGSASKAAAGHGDSGEQLEALLPSAKQAVKENIQGAPLRKSPLTLPCGHTFCEPCISRWMEANSSCPICRTRLAGDDDNASARASPPVSRPVAGAARQWDADLYGAEFIFRLNSLHRLYPYVVSNEMVRNWSEQVRRNGPIDWDSVRRMQLHDPTVRQSHAHQGSMGASTSFGGGSSFGGGGAGGSW